MKKFFRMPLILMMILALALTGCQKDPAEDGSQEEAVSDLPYQALHLGDHLFVITKTPVEGKDYLHMPLTVNMEKAPDLQVGDIIALNFDIITKSYPGQVNVETVDKLEEESKAFKADFNLANDLLRIRPDQTYLMDVRTLEEYEAGHIPGSINIPVQEIESIVDLIPDQEATLLLYCRSGNRTVTASKALEDLGYKVIIDLGGISAYEGDLETGSGQQG